jgi:hypothetical protein
MQSKFKIVISDKLHLSSSTTEEDVACIKGMNKQDMGNGYIWYRLEPSDIDGEKITFSLCFYHGRCNSISLAIYNPEKYGCGWDDWSESKEKSCAEDTANWLNKIGFPVGKYSWGEVWAGYDPKGGSGHATIRFNAIVTDEMLTGGSRQ